MSPGLAIQQAQMEAARQAGTLKSVPGSIISAPSGGGQTGSENYAPQALNAPQPGNKSALIGPSAAAQTTVPYEGYQGNLSLVSTTPQGVAAQPSTGRSQLLGG